MKKAAWILAAGLLAGSAVGAHAQTTVSFGTWTGPGTPDTKLIQTLIKAYEDQHPDVHVKLLFTTAGPWGRDSYQTMFAAGTAPDLVYLNSGNFEMFARQGDLLPLNDIIQQDKSFNIKDFIPEAIDGSSFDGKIYALPYDLSDHVPYYNVDMFNQAGIQPPSPHWTWSDMEQIAKKLTKDSNGDGKVDVYGLGISADEWQWNSWLESSDARLFSADGKTLYATSSKFVNFMQWYFNLMWKDQIAPQDPGGIWRFGNQGVAMAVFGPWYRPTLQAAKTQFHYDVAMPPVGSGGKQGTVYYVDQFAITAKTRQPKAAWDLLKFLTGNEAWKIKMQLTSGGRSIPPIKQFALSDAFHNYAGIHNEVFINALAGAQKPVASLASGLGRPFLDIWWGALWPAWQKQQPLLPLLENLQKQADAKLHMHRWDGSE